MIKEGGMESIHGLIETVIQSSILQEKMCVEQKYNILAVFFVKYVYNLTVNLK